ncbi:hypothetical protein ACROSR_20240 [Roseovarius tibetensis]|uniref:hypothetical protein n=1 Tax=Roseovarius tibetensis TaxID=2685897 RepID=UPI003D7F344A
MTGTEIGSHHLQDSFVHRKCQAALLRKSGVMRDCPYTNLHGSELLCLLAASDGSDAVGLAGQFVPRGTAMIEDLVMELEDAVGAPIIAHELPDVFDRIEFGTFGWQREDADIVGHDARVGHMPTGLYMSTTASAPGATVRAISAWCRGIASVLQTARTSPAPLPRAGQIVPKTWLEMVR